MRRGLLYVIIKQAVHQKDSSAVNMDAVNIRAPKYIKKILIEPKGKVEEVSDQCGQITQTQDK